MWIMEERVINVTIMDVNKETGDAVVKDTDLMKNIMNNKKSHFKN